MQVDASTVLHLVHGGIKSTFSFVFRLMAKELEDMAKGLRNKHPYIFLQNVDLIAKERIYNYGGYNGA